MLIHGNIILIPVKPQLYQLILCTLKLGRDNLLFLCDIHRKRHKRWRHVNVVKGSGHAVLAADGSKPVSDLGIIGSEQCGKWLAPALRIRSHPPEILLEGKPDLAVISACRHHPGYGFRHRIDSAMIRAPGGQIRVKAAAHHGDRVRLPPQDGELRHHGLSFRQLVFSTIGHENAGRPDG